MRKFLPATIPALIFLASFGAGAEENRPPGALPKPVAFSTPGPNQKLKEEQEKLALENDIAAQKLKQQLNEQTAEKQRIELENALATQKRQADLAAKNAEIERLSQQIVEITKREDLRQAKQKAELAAELAETQKKVERLKAENELASAELAASQRELQKKDQEIQLRMKELSLQKGELDIQVAKFNAEISLWEKREDWKNLVNRQIEYPENPLKDGVLTISDRRIALNGPITMDTADRVCERIDYFNNQNPKYPIFIVIDNSPGGSVMAGYRILKAMEGSPAPVYTVVKSFAASMAAGITTLAKKSFAYPNAIILHHQLSNGMIGNLTVQQENIRTMEEWWKRLATPVAAKMGVSLDEFVKQMYANTATGDWKEFADKAKKLKWVDEVVDTIREESLVKNPDVASADLPPPRPMIIPFGEKVDASGVRYQPLPKLNPLDCYYLYNPDGYYRIEK